MASKRKRVVLSLADKLKIIEQLDKGVTGKKLSEIYGVGQSTISDIKNSKSTLLNFVSIWLVRSFQQTAAAENFIEKFKTASESYDPEFVYNADETGLVWKALPKTTLASKRESSAPGHKVSKERVTVLNCANSTGNHKLPLLLIGKSRNPRAFKNVKKLPLFYKSQPKAWMTAALFTEWYDEVFIPEVKKHQKSVGKEGSKVLLIVDNAPTHPTAELLERENGQFKTTFLPPNVTSLLQPMDQSVI
ncbi:unnamed protein product [Arctia plantaginis]|uniref:HTH psq-type domain-containing protein n=1 Tax=Arctia plantaginis TaxID=874455 RepID=A0A8S0YYS4_ARCPL|nr:unnamed protein product [Arctia plantaginis]